MAKTKISEYSATAANNTDVESVNIAEGCAPSGINNAIREVMSHLKDFQVGSAGDDLTVGGNFSVTGTVTIPDNAISGDKVEGGTINAITINTLSANPTLSAGTANGVTYLNGSKVLTSGSGLTTNGSSLGVGSSDFGGAGSINVSVGVAGTTTGGLQLWSTTTGQHYVQFGDGTAGAATYAGAIGYSHATDQMFFYTNGSEAMRLTSTSLYTASGINVGIGTSSPNSYAGFSTLTLNGTSGGEIDFEKAGTVNGSIYNPSGGDNFAITAANVSGSLLLQSGGYSTRATLDSSGNLGLGVTPSAWASAYKVLQIGSASSIFNTSSSTLLVTNGYIDSGFAWRYQNTSHASRYTLESGSHIWYTAPSGTAGDVITFTQAMTLTAAGNLGIGTSSPSQKLHVASTSNAQGLFETTGAGGGSNRSSVILQGPSNTWYINTNGSDLNGSDGALGFYGNSATRMVIDTSGNLGLGVTPSAWVAGYKVLQVGNASWYTDGNANIYLAANTYQASGFVDTYISSNEAAKYEQINGAHRWFNAPSGTAGNAISFTQAMTLNSNGALCINRTDQQNDERLAVFGNVGQQCMSLKSPITTAYDMINIINGNGQVGTIQTNGSATSYNTSSDYRLKENVVTEWDATTRLKQLKPSRFNFIADADTTVDGFLAHEVQEIVPEAITGTKDAVDADGNPKYQGIDQSKLVPLLVKTIQEQQAIIESLTARVSALEGN
jgi:hypothetical protein